MVFRRRARRPVGTRLVEILWPSMGWGCTLSYLWHRIRRLPGTPESIAVGLACGAAISFTPLVGAHFVLAALTAWALGGSFVASAIGTLVGNPWTFPGIWYGAYRLGRLILGVSGNGGDAPDFATLFSDMVEAIIERDMARLVQDVWPVWAPTMVGGVPLAILAFWITYKLARPAIASYQNHRRLRRELGGRLRRVITSRPSKDRGSKP
ncbi:MAG: DUF2062 domain-containing protein [Alphaproteobacteria bacterium]